MEVTSRSLTLVEGGEATVVSADEWEVLGLTDLVSALADRRIITHERVGPFHLLSPTRFVGVAHELGKSIEIKPKHPQFYKQVQSLLGSYGSRVVTLHNLSGRRSHWEGRDAVSAFLMSLQEVLAAGIPFEYVSRSLNTSSPRGRINPTGTIRQLRSRGNSHRVICDVPTQEPWRGVDSIVTTTAAHIYRSVTLNRDLARSLDDYTLFFSGTEVGTHEAVADAKVLLESSDDEPEMGNLLRAAIAILEGRELAWTSFEPTPRARANFCLLQDAWEIALAHALISAETRIHYQLHPYQSKDLRFLGPLGPNLDPDIVGFRGATPAIVIDAKYKVVDNRIADDVYQAACYGDTLGVPLSLLVYLTEEDTWVRTLDETVSGTAVWIVGVSVKPDADSIQTIVQALADRVAAYDPRT